MHFSTRFLSVAAIALVAVAGFGVSLIDEPLKSWWWTAALAGLLILGIWAQVAFYKRELELEGASADLIERASMPLGGIMDEMARFASNTPGARLQQLPHLQSNIVSEVRSVLSQRHTRSRCILYVLDERGVAVPEVQKGRRGLAQAFEPGTDDGDAALQFMASGQPGICNDVDKDPWPGWGGNDGGYKAFIACPVAIERVVYGMVTFDVPESNTLSDWDREIVVLFATLIGVACSITRDASGRIR